MQRTPCPNLAEPTLATSWVSSSSGLSHCLPYGFPSTKCKRDYGPLQKDSLRLIAHSSRHLFTAKAIFVPIAGFVFFIWVIVRAKGVGPIIQQPGTLHGSDLGWAMIVSLMSCISNMATLAVNAPDFASRAATPSAAALPQLITMPLGFIIVSFMGIIVSSSSTVIYGQSIWNPIDLLGKFLDPDADGNGPSSATRFGVWFISAAFILAQVRILPRGSVLLTTIYRLARYEHFCKQYFSWLRLDFIDAPVHGRVEYFKKLCSGFADTSNVLRTFAVAASLLQSLGSPCAHGTYSRTVLPSRRTCPHIQCS